MPSIFMFASLTPFSHPLNKGMDTREIASRMMRALLPRKWLGSSFPASFFSRLSTARTKSSPQMVVRWRIPNVFFLKYSWDGWDFYSKKTQKFPHPSSQVINIDHRRNSHHWTIFAGRAPTFDVDLVDALRAAAAFRTDLLQQQLYFVGQGLLLSCILLGLELPSQQLSVTNFYMILTNDYYITPVQEKFVLVSLSVSDFTTNTRNSWHHLKNWKFSSTFSILPISR